MATRRVTFNQMKAILLGKKKKAENAAPIMRKIAGDMRTQVDLRFRGEHGPDGKSWEPLAESTVRARRKGRIKARAPKILRDSGDLSMSIHSKYNESTAIAGTNVLYARYQQLYIRKGSLKNGHPYADKPGRPFIGFSDKQIENYRKWLAKYILQ